MWRPRVYYRGFEKHRKWGERRRVGCLPAASWIHLPPLFAVSWKSTSIIQFHREYTHNRHINVTYKQGIGDVTNKKVLIFFSSFLFFEMFFARTIRMENLPLSIDVFTIWSFNPMNIYPIDYINFENQKKIPTENRLSLSDPVIVTRNQFPWLFLEATARGYYISIVFPVAFARRSGEGGTGRWTKREE